MIYTDDIIAAIATPIGEGGISVIRVSGKGSIELVDKGFGGTARLQSAKSHTAHVSTFTDGNKDAIDQVVATIFRGPNSYTGEDVVELSCHGGMFVTRRILGAVIASGARLAELGEFTKRAFLNGRIDLSQAEAVADLIHARSERALRSSLIQLKGSLSERIKSIMERITHLCGLVELELDFIEEDITLTSPTSMGEEIRTIVSKLEELIRSFDQGKMYRDGVKVVLVGRPNVGKSSLLNALLDQNRAIVTEIPGTTRDVIEESMILEGMLFRFVDTAGIRTTTDPVEKEGVDRTIQQIENADVCLYVLDLSCNDAISDNKFINNVRMLRNGHRSIEILVGNKLDLVDPNSLNMLNYYELKENSYIVSAKTHHGIDNLVRGLCEKCLKSEESTPDISITITNERHKSELEKAVVSLEATLESISAGQSGEVIAVDLRGAVTALGSIIGMVTTEDILNDIFSKFCIGK